MNTFEKIICGIAAVGTVALAVEAAEEKTSKSLELQRGFSRSKQTSYYPSQFEIETFNNWCEVNGYVPIEEVSYGTVIRVKAAKKVLQIL